MKRSWPLEVEVESPEGILHPLAERRAIRHELPEPEGDLAHRLLLALLLDRLVVVEPDEELDPQVEHLPPEVADQDEVQQEVEVLHATESVTDRIEQPDRLEGIHADEHESVSRVDVADAQVDRVAVLLAEEAGADHSDLLGLGGGVQHSLEVANLPEHLDAGRQHEVDGGQTLDVGQPVVHAHVGEADVQGVAPGVALGHLDDHDLTGGLLHHLAQPGPHVATRGLIVRVDDDDDQTSAVLDGAAHGLDGSLVVVVGTDQNCDILKHDTSFARSRA